MITGILTKQEDGIVMIMKIDRITCGEIGDEFHYILQCCVIYIFLSVSLVFFVFVLFLLFFFFLVFSFYFLCMLNYALFVQLIQL